MTPYTIHIHINMNNTKQATPLKLNYIVLGTGKETRVKFFYEGNNGEYGEFYIYFNRETYNLNNPTDNLGVRGQAELAMKDPDYAIDLLQALAPALGFKLSEKEVKHE